MGDYSSLQYWTQLLWYRNGDKKFPTKVFSLNFQKIEKTSKVIILSIVLQLEISFLYLKKVIKYLIAVFTSDIY